MHPHRELNFNEAPFLLIWEITQACAQACLHCRAEAIPSRHAGELTLAEGEHLIDQLAEMGTPILILTGGDPLERDDLEDLIRHGKARGLRVGAIPAATPRLTAERVQHLAAAGLDQMALSLDAVSAEQHDAFRGVEGSFARTLAGARYARQAGLRLQINTVFAAWNVGLFDPLRQLVEELGAVFWEVFFLVPTGRGSAVKGLTPEQYEDLFAKLHALQRQVSYIVKVTEAPHYRMFVAERERRRQTTDGASPGPSTGARIRQLLARETGPAGGVGQAPRGVNSGKGFVFVSHTGDVFPSGFLPVRAGNVRQTPLAELYRDTPVFRELRDAALLKGRCGVCPYRELCGGSRSRAYALTGDYLAEDQSCRYQPPTHAPAAAQAAHS
ncbi:MAG: TIGR04053 family radical SAM/SPASM domain-containing protein [Candidatus Tectomicrobia bacterium]|nr:TIGR04053 family radical SAM/SPASM domain-containing protein [Candidatus Tectomicrobia bacterium]